MESGFNTIGDYRSLIALALLLSLASGAGACLPADAHSIFDLKGVSVDYARLSQICSPQDCTVHPDRIIVRSSAENIYLTVRNRSIRFKERNKTGAWGGIVYSDLRQLRRLGVLLEDEETVELLSRRAQSARRVSRCMGEWRTFTLDCGCEPDTGVEWCMDCVGDSVEELVPPKKLFFSAASPRAEPTSLEPPSFLERLVGVLRGFLNRFF